MIANLSVFINQATCLVFWGNSNYVKPDPEKSPYNWKPSAQKIEITAALLHEWVGMLYAKIKTRGSNKNAPPRAKTQKDS
jgi:hypothetical protein